MRKLAIFLPAVLCAVLLWAAYPPMGETANVAVAGDFPIFAIVGAELLGLWYN